MTNKCGSTIFIFESSIFTPTWLLWYKSWANSCCSCSLFPGKVRHNPQRMMHLMLFHKKDIYVKAWQTGTSVLYDVTLPSRQNTKEYYFHIAFRAGAFWENRQMLWCYIAAIKTQIQSMSEINFHVGYKQTHVHASYDLSVFCLDQHGSSFIFHTYLLSYTSDDLYL